MRIINGFEAAKSALSRQIPRGLVSGDEREQAVRAIIEDIDKRGDVAVREYSRKFDGVVPDSWEISKEQIPLAYKEIAPDLLDALKLAAERIRAFHESQRESLRDGEINGASWRMRPLNRIGVYVPHGTAPYPSSLLMTAIPAKVAGVKEVILATPPGKIPPAIMVAADIAGIDRAFAVGGAQAIAALALGTESIPKVDKICGPGNIYVMLAKKFLFGVVGIDGLYGPSEVLVIADSTASPQYCTADLLAQAEHDTLASAILVTISPELADRVNHEIEQQLAEMPRREIAEQSLEKSGVIAVVDNINEAIELANLYAPEHLLLMVEQAQSYLEQLSNAGCIVIGKKATIALGDYVAGPSHALPTEGTARFSSSLNITDFMKITNIINEDSSILNELGKAAITIARSEGLEAHARAVEKRLEKGNA